MTSQSTLSLALNTFIMCVRVCVSAACALLMMHEHFTTIPGGS